MVPSRAVHSRLGRQCGTPHILYYFCRSTQTVSKHNISLPFWVLLAGSNWYKWHFGEDLRGCSREGLILFRLTLRKSTNSRSNQNLFDNISCGDFAVLIIYRSIKATFLLLCHQFSTNFLRKIWANAAGLTTRLPVWNERRSKPPEYVSGARSKLDIHLYRIRMNINEPKLFLRNGQREVIPKYTDLAPEHAILANLFFDMVLYSSSKWIINIGCTHLIIRLHSNTYSTFVPFRQIRSLCCSLF